MHIAERGLSGVHPWAEGHYTTAAPDVGDGGVIVEGSDLRLPPPKSPAARLLRALVHYVHWHEYLLGIADEVARVEAVDPVALCRRLKAVIDAAGGKPKGECPSGDEEEPSREAWRELLQRKAGKQQLPQTCWRELEELHAG